MGQAKQRGSKEQRVTEGISKRMEETLQRQRERDEAEAALTLEQRELRHRARLFFAGILGMTQAGDLMRTVNGVRKLRAR